jgi:hypothetical protein
LPGGHFGRSRPHEHSVRAFRQRERDEPPDIDIDFEHERREEVIQYIYAKYGRDRAGPDRRGDQLSAAAAPCATWARHWGLSAGCVERVREIIGFPRHLSQHVGGFVITRGPLSSLVPIENAAMEDRTVIEWDKDDSKPRHAQGRCAGARHADLHPQGLRFLDAHYGPPRNARLAADGDTPDL